MRLSSVACLAGFVCLATPAFGQAINIDVGDLASPVGVPTIAYGAAGMPGVWNSVDGTVTGTPVNLLDVTGAATSAQVVHSGGFGNFFTNNAMTTGDDEALMDDLQDVGGLGNTSTFNFSGLTNGTYKVLVYSWAPDNRTGFLSNVTVGGGSAGTQIMAGGAWPGNHQLGVTYAQDTTNVTAGTMQIMVATQVGFGSVNGIQLEPMSTFSSFCTAKTTTVCGAASISASGTPSATATSGFVVGAGPTRGCRSGLLLYSNQPVVPGVPFGGPGDGKLCLTAQGLRRAGPIESGGTSPATCDGNMSIDMNQFAHLMWAATGCAPPAGQNNPAGFLTNMGTAVNGQIWGRDSTATGQVLSDGLGWTVGP